MAGEITLMDALENLSSKSAATRKNGLQDLRHILRNNTNGTLARNVTSNTWLDIYQALFQYAIDERSVMVKAKSQTTRTSCANRLTDIAATLRISVEAGVQALRTNTVRALLDHLFDMMYLSSGEVCEPLAVDYAKCIRVLFKYQPHVEQLVTANPSWAEWTTYCIDGLGRAAESTFNDVDVASTTGSMIGLSVRSSRSHIAASQEPRFAAKQLAEEFVACLQLLTAAPNAPLGSRGGEILQKLIEFLQTAGSNSRALPDAFTTMNQVLSWSRTNSIALTRNVTGLLIRIIRNLWSSRSSATTQMLITLLLLRPYLFQALGTNTAFSLRTDLVGLLQAMQNDYAGRQERDRQKPLSLDDLRMEITRNSQEEDSKVATTLFSLRCVGVKGETNWLLVYMMASLYHLLMINGFQHEDPMAEQDSTSADQSEDRPRKRQRLQDHFTELMETIRSEQASPRTCALQILAFLAQQKRLTSEEWTRACDAVTIACGDENSTVASWAFLAMASCMSQAVAAKISLTSKCASIWQLASRSLSSTTSCRAASYTILIMLRLQLVPQASVSEFAQSIAESMDLNGPSQLSDAASQMLKSVLSFVQRMSPGTAPQTADSIIVWLSRTFAPSKIDDRPYATASVTYEGTDVLALVFGCLNRNIHIQCSTGIRVWDGPARAWLLCRYHHSLVSYLLLNAAEDVGLHPKLTDVPTSPSPIATGQSAISTETLVLAHLSQELTQISIAWTASERTRQLTHDTYVMLCKAATAFTCVINCITFRDTRRQAQIQEQVASLMSSLSDYMSTTSDDAKADAYLFTASSTFRALSKRDDMPHQPFSCERLVCKAVETAISNRQTAKNIAVGKDDMDLDEEFESQDSRKSHTMICSPELLNDFDLAFSKVALWSNAALYARVVTSLDEQSQKKQTFSDVSNTITDELLSQPVSSLLASRNVIKILPTLGLSLSIKDTERLLEGLLTEFTTKYAHKRSEVALGTTVDIWESQTPLWTDSTNKSLYNLGIDIYEWFTNTRAPDMPPGALPGTLSPNVQKRLARVLCRLCDLDFEYPQSKAATSVSYNLFTLIENGDTTLQSGLADQISTIFEGFTLSQHQKIFKDLELKLPNDFKWVEGIAMRLLFFSKLGARWHSLLSHCVYHIFETAGREEDSLRHATYCIAELAANLPLKSPRRLFSLFAPQLLFTWQEIKEPLTKLPFAAFQYSSLADMLAANESEVCAHLAVQGSKDDIDTMSKALKVLPRDLYRRSFAKCYAYAIKWDIGNGKGDPNVEHRLREAVGGKDTAKGLVSDNWPAIMGYLYLTVQQEHAENRWLQTRQNYEDVNNAFIEIQSYSDSTRPLPSSHGSFSRPQKLPDEVERVVRRIGLVETPWSISSFTLTARMLLDAIDESLGSLHACLMIRRLRLLICMAGPFAYTGFALETLVHSLLPFIKDSECADDTIGLLQYLFYRGQPYLEAKLLATDVINRTHFLGGTVILLVLRMRQHSKERQARSTQESQHTATVEKMEIFSRWLVTYFRGIMVKTGYSATIGTLADDLATLHLPGNAHSDSPESRLLLFLLKQWAWDETFCSKADATEALKLLSNNFETAVSSSFDCLNDDVTSVEYSQSLWEVMCAMETSDKFAFWGAQVLGRAYASTGTRPTRLSHQSTFVRDQADNVPKNNIAISQATIAETWFDLLFSRSRLEAGIAEHSLRKFLMTETSDPAVTIAFEQMMSETVQEAMKDGTFEYVPPARQRPATVVNGKALQQALEHSTPVSVEDWVTDLAIIVCRWAKNVPMVANLEILVQNVPGLAMKILPSILHILLVKELDHGPALREALSNAVTACLSETDTGYIPKQRFLLELLMYLRSQPYPQEATRVDRLRWLDVDYLLAAHAGARCGMATCALLLAESAPPQPKATRRSSTHNSLSELPQETVSGELLLSIYQQLEEPDSFYGVPQPASLESVLHRLDHEADGFKSLMFRSAQADSHLRQARDLPPSDAAGLVRSLWDLSFNSLTFSLLSHGLGKSLPKSHEMLSSAQALQQWDIAVPDTTSNTSTFTIFQELSRASDLSLLKNKLELTIIDHIRKGMAQGKADALSHSWYTTLAGFTETAEVMACADYAELDQRWRVMQARDNWMHLARYDEVKALLSSRHTLFGVLRHNASIQKTLRLNNKQCHAFEAEALLHSSRLAREHSRLQDALAASTSLNDMMAQYQSVNLSITAAIKEETACVLWDARESTASVKMLRDILAIPDVEKQDIPVGKAGLHAQLARQLAEARLEKPEEILSRYLKPAISDLKGIKDKKEAGKVYYEFASFCDSELSNPDNVENLARIVKLRQGKEEEVEATNLAIKNAKKTGDDKQELGKTLVRAKQWLQIDSAEEKRLRSNRMSFIHQSLQNYLLTLRYTDDHDICVLRFFALWLENADDQEANGIVLRYLREVPSWKFVLLMNQLMSRVAEEATAFQKALKELLDRIFKEHPHQSIHHLFASYQTGASQDPAANSRYNAARGLAQALHQDAKYKNTVNAIWAADRQYRRLAEATPQLPANVSKCRLRDIPAADQVAARITQYPLPPVTLSIPLRPSADYSDVPRITSFDDKVSIMTGLSHPKVLTCLDSNGDRHRQLFKGGNDDLRQDAIMEQVFEEVSKMLRNHKATRQRDLKVRTYKVIPLSTGSGIIEFVPNSLPIMDYLKPAHKRYHPKDYSEGKARDLIRGVEKDSQESRVKMFRKVCDNLQPVLRHFFFERFDDPDEWFEKRTAYTRTTASISILGHVLGLGDRHNSNILLDEKTGEIVHIDLGVAFEAGRVLPIPEKVPFRMTRDITDGMGPTKTEGVFRRCCEFTLDAVREDKKSIMTLLNVLRYDPLYSWSVSPLRAKRMQEAQEMSRNAPVEEADSSKRREEEAGEADRALSIVEKKLSKTLSTQATVNELIQQATDETNLATLFAGWGAFW